MRTQKGHEHSVKSSIKSGEDAEKMGRYLLLVEASAQPHPGLFLCSHFHQVFVVCPPVCATVCPSSRLSVVERALLAFFQDMHIHDGSGSLHVEACARARVRVYAGFNWAVVRGGSSASASQVEGEQGSHCLEHSGFSIVSAPLLLPCTSALPPRQRSPPFHQATFALIRR